MNRRHVALALLAGVTVLTAVAVVPVAGDYYAGGNVHEVTASVVDASVADDGQQFVVTVRIHNPTPRALTVPEKVAYSDLRVYAGDTYVNEPRMTEIDSARIPAGGSDTARFTFETRPAHVDGIADRLDGATIRGQLPFVLDGNELEADVTLTVGGDGS
jgi:LEA14-like dessication related protein